MTAMTCTEQVAYWRCRPGAFSAMQRWLAFVENVRVDCKPRQRHVAYLVTFTESLVTVRPCQRGWIWDHVTARVWTASATEYHLKSASTLKPPSSGKRHASRKRNMRHACDAERNISGFSPEAAARSRSARGQR